MLFLQVEKPKSQGPLEVSDQVTHVARVHLPGRGAGVLVNEAPDEQVLHYLPRRECWLGNQQGFQTGVSNFPTHRGE